MADGTTDKNGNEVYSVVFRYLKNGKAMETLLTIEKADDISALGISKLLIDRIETYGVDDEKIINQCYDGAAVMSGQHGGVQTLIQQHYGRTILYVHCFNHRLHLVITDVLKNINACRLFIGEVKLLHKVRREYEGTNIPRLMEQRWSGHLNAINSIRKNYDELLETLTKIKEGYSRKFDGDDMASASGLASSMMQKNFIFMLHVLHELLNAIGPANQILQKRDVGFRLAMPVIEAALESVQRFRTDDAFDSFLQSTEDKMYPDEDVPRPRRIRRRSSRLNESIVMETLGDDSRDDLKPVYFEIIDNITNEFEKRFHNNSAILTALSDLNTITDSNFDRKTLEPLERIGLILPFEAELDVVSRYLIKEKDKPENAESSNLKILFPVRSAFPQSYRLFEACESSTSVNECAFSALARIDVMKRMSMSTDLRCQLSVFVIYHLWHSKNKD